MRTLALLSPLALLWTVAAAQPAPSPDPWVAGKHYQLIRPAQPVNTPKGQVEVIEVFSYGCPACYQFYPIADQLKAALPKNARLSYLPASWHAAENWPTFQRAYLTALALGVADKAHNPMFNAIWKSGELAVVDLRTNAPKRPLPSIDDIAKFYARTTGIKAADFVGTAKSFSVEAQMRNADTRIQAYGTESTPTIVVQGKYRVTGASAGGIEQLIQLVNYLVAKETVK
jgi:protein dithiol oxidoreductase (disulfide-forming)